MLIIKKSNFEKIFQCFSRNWRSIWSLWLGNL